MKTFITKFGQLLIIIALARILAYTYSSKKQKVNVGVFNASIYAEEELNESIETMKASNYMLFEDMMGDEAIQDSVKQDLKIVHLLTDSACLLINDLKYLVAEMSGGLLEKDNFYTMSNLAYNMGHKNKLTGDKGKDNGEGIKLKLQMERLRELEQQLVQTAEEKKFIQNFLNTSGRQENNSDYIFS